MNGGIEKLKGKPRGNETYRDLVAGKFLWPPVVILYTRGRVDILFTGLLVGMGMSRLLLAGIGRVSNVLVAGIGRVSVCVSRG
ncbi:unnamed protein product [Citrullus colocynthis]|uniref:Uncharacterized protein n=1 Tax=Citrullus colocynthis TaxID=252529 RepID=A0ABP0XVT7_9ROSI